MKYNYFMLNIIIDFQLFLDLYFQDGELFLYMYLSEVSKVDDATIGQWQ